MSINKIENFRYYESVNGIYGVKISNQKLQYLHDLCKKSHPCETGGILIGRYSENLKWAEIMAATGAPMDSRRTPYAFIRSTKGIPALLKSAWKKRQYYLGEWHYHPDSSPKPSEIDLKTMYNLSKNEDLNCPEPVLLIIGGRQFDWCQYIGVYTRNQEIELHETNIDREISAVVNTTIEI